MTDATVFGGGVESGGRDLSSDETSHESATPIDTTAGSALEPIDDVIEVSSWIVDALVVGVVCLLAMSAASRRGWAVDATGDDVVPLLALAGIWIATMRRRPDRRVKPVRVVSARLACLVFVAAGALVTFTVISPTAGNERLGPMITLAMLGTYLALWGFRSLALLRTVVLLSLLTWAPIASAVHDLVRQSLDQPSALIYQRLARIELLGVSDEPWTLFTAELHRGTLVVLGALVLGVAATRLRLGPRVILELLITTAFALVAHHVIVITSPLDEYAPTDTTQVVTNPVLEVAIAACAVATLLAVRWRRARGLDPRERSDDARSATPDSSGATIADRDPIIFDAERSSAHPVLATLLFSGIAPLAALGLLA